MDWFRCWIEVEEADGAAKTVPIYAVRSSIKLDRASNLLTLKFPRKCPELDAVLQGFKFEPGPRFFGNFEWKATSTSGTLKALGNGFSLSADDLMECDLSAYFVLDEEAKEPKAITLEIVPELTGSGKQVSLSPGGGIEVSSDLVGRTVKVRCTYRNAIVVSQQKVETLTAHLIKVEGEKVYWIGLQGCTIAELGNPLRLSVDWNTAKSECLTP